MAGPSGGGIVTPVYLANGIVDYTQPDPNILGISTNHYIPFSLSYPYGGKYGTRGLSQYLPAGNICVPGDICKLSFWADIPKYGTSGEYLQFSIDSETFLIESVQENDWTDDLKTKWLESYMDYCGLKDLKVNNILKNSLISYWESLNGFEKLSGPSIAYVNKNSDNEEISVGMNTYFSTFFLDWAQINSSQPESAQIRSLLSRKEHTPLEYKDFYISNACKITYKNITQIAWCFDGIVYEYDLSDINPAPALNTGGGNIFGEVRLGGMNTTAHYLAKKFVHPEDPTLGLCSGVGGPFCIGDVILIVDNSSWSGTSGSGEWQWVGDITQTDYMLHVADIKNPCQDYRSVPVSEMLFPLRVIQDCIFDDFD